MQCSVDYRDSSIRSIFTVRDIDIESLLLLFNTREREARDVG